MKWEKNQIKGGMKMRVTYLGKSYDVTSINFLSNGQVAVFFTDDNKETGESEIRMIQLSEKDFRFSVKHNMGFTGTVPA